LATALPQIVGGRPGRGQHGAPFESIAFRKYPHGLLFASPSFRKSAMTQQHTTLAGRLAVLDLVKRDGPVSADAMAEKLGITGMAVRQHLAALAAEGLAEYAEE